MSHTRFLCLLLGVALVAMVGCQEKCPPPVDQSQLIQHLADSVYSHYEMRTTTIPTPKGIVDLFGKAGFVAPDSVWEQCYLKRDAGGSDTRVCLERLQFLDIFIQGEDTTDEFSSNRKTFASFQKRFQCCYGGVRGYVNFFDSEIVFEFGDGQWSHTERFILTCDQVVQISDQGHSMSEIVIAYDGKRVDSVACDVGFY